MRTIAIVFVFLAASLVGCADFQPNKDVNIRNGMSKADVERNIGFPGDVSSRGELEAWQYFGLGFFHDIYTIVWFHEGKVIGTDGYTKSEATLTARFRPIDWGLAPRVPGAGGVATDRPPHERPNRRQAVPLGPALIATGTGFLVDGQSHLLTNNHVAGDCKSLSVKGALEGEARLRAADPANDLALLQVLGRDQMNAGLALVRKIPCILPRRSVSSAGGRRCRIRSSAEWRVGLEAQHHDRHHQRLGRTSRR